MVLKSRNTMVVTAVLFLLLIIVVRLSGGFFEENVVRIVGAISGGKAENIPLLDFSSMGNSWLNPANWSISDMMSGVNEWFHDFIDSVLPAAINLFNLATIPVAATTTATRVTILGATAKVSVTVV